MRYLKERKKGHLNRPSYTCGAVLEQISEQLADEWACVLLTIEGYLLGSQKGLNP